VITDKKTVTGKRWYLFLKDRVETDSGLGTIAAARDVSNRRWLSRSLGQCEKSHGVVEKHRIA
jgi:hypothetical protein